MLITLLEFYLLFIQIYFREEPEINTSTLSIDYLGCLPEETFGKKYWNFLSKNVSNNILHFDLNSYLSNDSQSKLVLNVLFYLKYVLISVQTVKTRPRVNTNFEYNYGAYIQNGTNENTGFGVSSTDFVLEY